jgi:hypothetical protein
MIQSHRYLTVRLEAIDRRRAAIHEAGHLEMARHFGVHGLETSIWPISQDDPNHDIMLGSSWFGQMRYPLAIPRISQLSEIRRMMIAVSGAMAVTVWRGQFEPEPDAHSAVNAYIDDHGETDTDQMSVTDWDMSGCDRGNWTPKLIRSAERAYDLLRGPLWAPLCQTARALIREGRVPLAIPHLWPGAPAGRRRSVRERSAERRAHSLKRQ